MAETPYIQSYEGVTKAQAYEWFRADATLAASDGWHPVSSRWEGGELRVVYARGETEHGETTGRDGPWVGPRPSRRGLGPILPWLAVGAAVGAISALVVGPTLERLLP